MKSEFEKHKHTFWVVAGVVMVALDRLSSQTMFAQLVSCILVLSIIAAYAFSLHKFYPTC